MPFVGKPTVRDDTRLQALHGGQYSKKEVDSLKNEKYYGEHEIIARV